MLPSTQRVRAGQALTGRPKFESTFPIRDAKTEHIEAVAAKLSAETFIQEFPLSLSSNGEFLYEDRLMRSKIAPKVRALRDRRWVEAAV